MIGAAVTPAGVVNAYLVSDLSTRSKAKVRAQRPQRELKEPVWPSISVASRRHRRKRKSVMRIGRARTFPGSTTTGSHSLR
jgi:hypothetical protein